MLSDQTMMDPPSASRCFRIMHGHLEKGGEQRSARASGTLDSLHENALLQLSTAG